MAYPLRQVPRTVVLGSKIYLHDGLHGALTDHPPDGVEYAVTDARHVALTGRGAVSVFDELAAGEITDFGSGGDVVHSAYFPVLNRRAWVVDTDHLVFPVAYGDYSFTTAFRTKQHAFATRDPEYQALMTARIARMLRAFAHESCKAILFHTRQGLAQSARMVTHLAPDHGEAIRRKMVLLTPGLPRIAQDRLDKWRDGSPFTVVFCGRWFGPKKGELALRVLARLLRIAPDVHAVYIGPVPIEKRLAYASVLECIEYHEWLPRAGVLAILARSHLLLHPSAGESVGAILGESATAGMAIVMARDGLEHAIEWFDEGGAVMIERANLGPGEEEARFFDVLRGLVVEDPAEAERMGRFNHTRAREGLFSVTSRNAVLQRLYDEGAASASEPLTLDTFASDHHGVVSQVEPDAFRRMRADLLNQAGLTGQCVPVEIEF